MQRYPKLTKAQLLEIRNHFELRVEEGSLSHEEIDYLLHSSRQFNTYRDWKAGLPLVTPKAIVTERTLVRHRKRVPRGPGKKPKKQLIQVRLEAEQVEGLKALGGNISEHLRKAVEGYLRANGGGKKDGRGY